MARTIKIILTMAGLLILFLILGVITYRFINSNRSSYEKLNKLDSNFTNKSADRESILLIEDEYGGKNHMISNKMAVNDRFYLSSISKLYTHGVIHKLADENLVELSRLISDYLSNDLIEGLLLKDGKGHAKEITVQNLLDKHQA